MAAMPLSPGNNPIGRRLKLAMEKRGVNCAELAKRTGIKTSFLYDVLRGKSANPSPTKLARAAKALGINLNQLVAIDGKRITAIDVPPDYVTIPRITVNKSSVIAREHENERYYFRREWITDHLNANTENLRLLYIDGDSMEPTLCHHDMVLVDTIKNIPTPPGIFVLLDGTGLVSKRLEYAPKSRQKRIRITADNPRYSSYDAPVEEIFIVGRIVWFAREV